LGAVCRSFGKGRNHLEALNLRNPASKITADLWTKKEVKTRRRGYQALGRTLERKKSLKEA